MMGIRPWYAFMREDIKIIRAATANFMLERKNL